jgi:pimeloyl-ACP methyl ester carboxylesterase
MAKMIDRSSRLSRRMLLTWIGGGVSAVAVAGVTGFELVDHGVLPGKQLLDRLDGACSVPEPTMSFAPLGASFSGRFYSKARRRHVGYTIAYPSGHHPGERLSLVVMLHGYGNDHTSALFGMTAAEAVALRFDGRLPYPVALVTVDGGNGYWNPHPGDDPMAMVVDELIPMCQKRGLGSAPEQILMMGISMGGYGALAITERNPGLVSAVAVISPAIWTSYGQARAANPGAFASARSFAAGDVIAHADKIIGVPVRVASGYDDPFHPGVEAFVRAAQDSIKVVFSAGCHDELYFLTQEPPSLAFAAHYFVHGG